MREAINYAINKALAKVAFSGYASVVEGVVPQGVDYAYKTGAWPHDIKKAKALLAEAGYPNGFESTLWSAYNDGTSVKAVQFLQQQLAQVGIKVSVEVLESGQRVQRVQQVQKPESQGPHVLRRLVLVDRRGRLGPASAADHAGFPARAQQRVVLLEQGG